MHFIGRECSSSFALVFKLLILYQRGKIMSYSVMVITKRYSQYTLSLEQFQYKVIHVYLCLLFGCGTLSFYYVNSFSVFFFLRVFHLYFPHYHRISLTLCFPSIHNLSQYLFSLPISHFLSPQPIFLSSKFISFHSCLFYYVFLQSSSLNNYIVSILRIYS